MRMHTARVSMRTTTKLTEKLSMIYARAGRSLEGWWSRQWRRRREGDNANRRGKTRGQNEDEGGESRVETQCNIVIAPPLPEGAVHDAVAAVDAASDTAEEIDDEVEDIDNDILQNYFRVSRGMLLEARKGQEEEAEEERAGETRGGRKRRMRQI
eukprot:4218614-Pyramimonas_sp.AAC.1